MVSTQLQKARDFEAQYGLKIPAEERPAFHATPTIGWMNDPNGLSFYQGKCHLFYQYHPYSNEWGPMHWGHLTTEDFIRWERLPVALAPDQPCDIAGCFSGGAVELPDGRHLLMYTGVQREPDENGVVRDVQTQCVAIGDGLNYEKYPLNPVLTKCDLPAGGSAVDFRDPKVWREPDGTYYAVIGNRTPDGSGAILLYRSKDCLNWEYVHTLEACHNKYGRMWECPDFFSLDGQYVLLTSPQDMYPMGLEFHAGNNVLCLLGNCNPQSMTFTRQATQAVDYGLDFYAPQTLLTPDGRRIMIAWMQNWSTAGAKPTPCRWFGQMSLPRELFIRDGRLCQRPVRELESYRGRPVLHHNIPVRGEVRLPGVQGRVVDMTVTIRPGCEGYHWFRIHVAKDDIHDTVIHYRPYESTLEIDRIHSGLPHDIVNTRSFLVHPQDEELKLRIILDRFSVEIFVNDGEQAASSVIYTQQEADAITFEADGQALIDVEKYDLTI